MQIKMIRRQNTPFCHTRTLRLAAGHPRGLLPAPSAGNASNYTMCHHLWLWHYCYGTHLWLISPKVSIDLLCKSLWHRRENSPPTLQGKRLKLPKEERWLTPAWARMTGTSHHSPADRSTHCVSIIINSRPAWLQKETWVERGDENRMVQRQTTSWNETKLYWSVKW